jgi:hypothetical protein
MDLLTVLLTGGKEAGKTGLQAGGGENRQKLAEIV